MLLKHFFCVFICFMGTILKFTSGSSDFSAFFQDLTEPIDKVISSRDHVDSQETLREALKISSRVYYTMDKSINHILDLIPVIKLLNECIPPGETPSLMVALPYTSQNRILASRYEDMFYNQSLNITLDSWQTLRKYISAIVIDLNTDGCAESEYLYSKPGHWSKHQPTQISFPENLKLFLDSIRNPEFGSPDANIPIVLAFNASQVGCADYLKMQYKNSDFDIITLNSSFIEGVPVSSTEFKHFSKKLGDWIYQLKYHYWQLPGKNFFYKLQLPENFTAQQLVSRWEEPIKSFLSSSPFLTGAVQHIIDASYSKNIELFRNSDSYNAYRQYSGNLGHILGSTAVSKLANQPASNHTTGMIIPIVSTNDLTIEIVSRNAQRISNDHCRITVDISRATNGTLVFNRFAWGAFANQQKKLQEINAKCTKSIGYTIDYGEKRKIILVFESGISKMWLTLEKHINGLVDEHREVLNSALNTIVFHEDDISSVSENSDNSTGYEAERGQIANFVRKWDAELSTGCVINFGEKRLGEIVREATGGEFREKLGKFCEPVFDVVDLFIWLVPQDYRVPDGWSGKHVEVVVARDLFLREFPEKQVFIQFNYTIKEYNAKGWADFYEVPVVSERTG